jgi:toxin ParE1/3/4
MLPIDWQPSADEDLAEILSYIKARNELAALRLFNLIESALEHTSEHPYLYKQSERVDGAREIVVHPNYILVYQVEQNCIKVLRVLHSRQKYPL